MDTPSDLAILMEKNCERNRTWTFSFDNKKQIICRMNRNLEVDGCPSKANLLVRTFVINEYYIYHFLLKWSLYSWNDYNVCYVAPWSCGNNYCSLHSTKSELRVCASSNPACGVSEICDGEDLWQRSRLDTRLHTFHQSTMPQSQFKSIIIIDSYNSAHSLNKLITYVVSDI